MLTNEDVKKLIEVFATREEVATKEDFEDLRKGFSDLQNPLIRTPKKPILISKK